MSGHLPRRAFLRAGAATAVAAVLVGCGDDGDGDATTSTSTSTSTSTTEAERGFGDRTTTTDSGEGLDLPENDTEAIIALFDPMFEPLGQHVVRAGLYDLEAGFVRDDGGTHLAIYVEPIDPEGEGWDTERYIDNVVPGAAAAAPFAFDRWADLRTFDVCQEPPQAENPEPEPPIKTQVLLSRADAALIDWDEATLADLIAGRMRSPDTMRVAGHPEVQEHPRWQEAEAAAEDLV